MNANRPSSQEAAFSLVEVTIALAIAIFCLSTVFGLLLIGMNSNRDSVRQTAAASLVKGLVADLRSTASVTNVSPTYGVKFSTTSAQTTAVYLREDGSALNPPGSVIAPATLPAPPSSGDPVYRATITVTPPPATFPHAANMARIQITWPPNINPSTQAPSGIYETIVGLDRN